MPKKNRIDTYDLRELSQTQHNHYRKSNLLGREHISKSISNQKETFHDIRSLLLYILK